MVERHVRLALVPLSSRISGPALLVALLAYAVPAQAQRRMLATDNPEAQIMGYYAAVMTFSPIGVSVPGFSVGGELSFIPNLSENDRRVGFGGTKLEDTNRCPVLPRLRVAETFARFAVEAGYVPPLTVCGVTANLLAAAARAEWPLNQNFRLMVRGSVLAGSLKAAITCGTDAVRDSLDQVCYQGSPSSDRVVPFTLGGDIGIVHGGPHHPRLDLYALVGVRRERVRFDVNFTNDSVIKPAVFDDHERLQTTFTRAHVAVGGGYWLTGRFRAGAELFYAPGALATVRGSLAYALRARAARVEGR